MQQNTFNANFFITAATVIPVLFLALTLQGSTYAELITYWQETVKKALEMNRALARLCDLLIYLIVVFVPISGCIGELRAMVALYDEHADNDAKQFVLISTIILLAITALNPVIRIFKAMILIIDTMDDEAAKHVERNGKSSDELPDGSQPEEESKQSQSE